MGSSVRWSMPQRQGCRWDQDSSRHHDTGASCCSNSPTSHPRSIFGGSFDRTGQRDVANRRISQQLNFVSALSTSTVPAAPYLLAVTVRLSHRAGQVARSALCLASEPAIAVHPASRRVARLPGNVPTGQCELASQSSDRRPTSRPGTGTGASMALRIADWITPGVNFRDDRTSANQSSY